MSAQAACLSDRVWRSLEQSWLLCESFAASALDELDLVAFCGVDERHPPAHCAQLVAAVRERIAFRFRVLGEFLQIVDFKGKMRQSGPTTTGPLSSNLQISISSSLPALEKDELRSAPGMWRVSLLGRDVAIKAHVFSRSLTR